MARQSFTQCLVNHLSDPIQYSLQSNSRFIRWHDISTSRMFWQDIAVNLDLFVKDCSCVTNVWYKHYGEKYFSSFIMTSSCKSALVRSSLSINALRACVYIQQLSSFRAPKLWCIDCCYMPYSMQFSEFVWIFFFLQENRQNRKLFYVQKWTPPIVWHAKH